MRSVMDHNFSQVPSAEIPRSSFDRSHGLKTTFNAGLLVPILVDEALPGDTFNCKMTAFARLATPLKPIMDNLFMETFFFAIPNRLVWTNWEKFNGAQDVPGDSIDFTIPTITSPAGGYGEQSVYDYFGLPTKIATLTHSALWNRALNLVWNEWFRDQNLQSPAAIRTDDGPDSDTLYGMLTRGKRHDYFTSALPWPQKGDAVSLPLGDSAPLTGIGVFAPTTTRYPDLARSVAETDGSDGAGGGTLQFYAASRDINITVEEDPDAYAADGTSWPNMRADLSNATAANINQLREAFQIQKLLERDARSGTRYVEVLKSHFGVTSPDFRLQRPEFLGGGSAPINVNPIAQTSEAGTTPQGNLSAFGTATLNNHGFVKSFTEHCIIIGLVNVRADLTYQQGLNRMWSRSTRYDFFWPALAHLGEQTILNKEIMAQGPAVGTPPDDEQVFGYQERYAEYRYKPSQITGLMRSNATASLDVWHLSQDFATLPPLNSSFIADNPPMARVEAVPSEPDFIMDAHFSMRCARPMPLYATPGMIDHF